MKKVLIIAMFVLSASFFAVIFFLLGSWLFSMSNVIRPKDVAWTMIGLPTFGVFVGLSLCALLLDYLKIEL